MKVRSNGIKAVRNININTKHFNPTLQSMLLLLNQMLSPLRKRRRANGFLIKDEDGDFEVPILNGNNYQVSNLITDFKIKKGKLDEDIIAFECLEGNLVLDSILSSPFNFIPPLSCQNAIRPIYKPTVEHKGISKFNILKKLGEGAFANVYLARNKNNGAFSALKVSKDMRDGEMTQVFFRRECHILEILNHPNIVKLYSKFETVKFGNNLE